MRKVLTSYCDGKDARLRVVAPIGSSVGYADRTGGEVIRRRDMIRRSNNRWGGIGVVQFWVVADYWIIPRYGSGWTFGVSAIIYVWWAGDEGWLVI